MRGEERRVYFIPVGVVLNLVHKVAIPGGRWRGDDGKALRQCRPDELLVHVGHPLVAQLLQDGGPPAGCIAQRVGRVYVVDGEAVAVELVKDGAHRDEYLDARREDLPGRLLEPEAQQAEGRGPYRGPGLGDGSSRGLLFLDKLEVTVARGVYAGFAHLGPHPVAFGQRLLQGVAHTGIQLEQR